MSEGDCYGWKGLKMIDMNENDWKELIEVKKDHYEWGKKWYEWKWVVWVKRNDMSENDWKELIWVKKGPIWMKSTEMREKDWYEWKGPIWVKRIDMNERDWYEWKVLMHLFFYFSFRILWKCPRVTIYDKLIN